MTRKRPTQGIPGNSFLGSKKGILGWSSLADENGQVDMLGTGGGGYSLWCSDILFPLPPPPLPIPTNPPGRPTREGLILVHFGSVWLRSAPFGSVWLRFGSVPGPFRVRFGGVGWGRGGVGERGFCKGKEYHYFGGEWYTALFCHMNPGHNVF